MKYDTDAQINISLQVIGLKLEAFKSVLTPEQTEAYSKFLMDNQDNLLSLLDKHLSPQEVDKVRKAIHK